MNKTKTHKKQNLFTIIKEVSPKKIIAVTKKHPIESVCLALENNIKKIAENKVQEAEKKYNKFNKREKIELHFIGKLQSNKIKKAVSLFDVIQTVENEKQIEKINKAAKEKNKIQKIYIQINISKDVKKGGIKKKEIDFFTKKIEKKTHLKLKGVMTILKKGTNKEKTLFYYKEIKKIQEKIMLKNKNCTETSMGMSQDYQEALKAGATEIRLGTALFGERKNET